MTELLQGVVTVLLFFLILGGLVLVHEVGHFVVARLARVRVLEFGIGFPPRALVIGRRGETVYTLNWLPIGGFVKLEGEDGDDGSDPRSFSAARLPVKLAILVAGVVVNLIVALGIFTAIATVATPQVGLRFWQVDPGSPAEVAGLRGGDAIVAVDGERFDLYSRTVVDALRAQPGEEVVLRILRADGTEEEVRVTLRTQAEIDAGRGALGIVGTPRPFEQAFTGETVGRPLGEGLAIGRDETVRWFGLILAGLGDLVGSIASDPTVAPPVSGPVGIATAIGDVFWGSGPILTLYVVGILSANLALVNALPFPPLDGGRMVVVTLKALVGRRLSLRVERLTYLVGFVALFTFLIWITWFDITRTLSGGTAP